MSSIGRNPCVRSFVSGRYLAIIRPDRMHDRLSDNIAFLSVYEFTRNHSILFLIWYTATRGRAPIFAPKITGATVTNFHGVISRAMGIRGNGWFSMTTMVLPICYCEASVFAYLSMNHDNRRDNAELPHFHLHVSSV